MRTVLIYSGTTEGRILAECLSRAQIPCVVSVATEYGSQMMPQLPYVKVREGRLSVEEMRRLARQEDVCAVVDATHPYAVDVTQNIRESVTNLRTIGGQAAEFARKLQEKQGEDSTRKGANIPGNVLYLRLQRQMEETGHWRESSWAEWFTDHESCARALAQTRGNILLTTGSKELAVYCEAIEDRSRLYVRVIPGAESLALCEKSGIPGRQIIAMQGPFSEAVNEALIEQYHIRFLVTKESGVTGGFPEKMWAAERAGIHAFVIGAPVEEDGYSFDEVIDELEKVLGVRIPVEEQQGAQETGQRSEEDRQEEKNDTDATAGGREGNPRKEEDSSGADATDVRSIWERERTVNSWIPMLLDTGEQMRLPERGTNQRYHRILETYRRSTAMDRTNQAGEDVVNLGNVLYTKSADNRSSRPASSPSQGSEPREGTSQIAIALIGVGMGNPDTMTVEARSVIEQAEYVYGAKRLLEQIPQEKHPKPYYQAKDILPELQQIESGRVAILFSGDTGFYSGSNRMLQELWQEGYYNIHIYPGISSVSYLAGLCGVGWQDAAIMSIHGRGAADQWSAELLANVRYHEKTFLLVSGVQDIRQLGQLLEEYGLNHCQVYAGYELSYPKEQVLQLTPQACRELWDEGLYVCLIQNPGAERTPLSPGMRDEDFIRDKIPMTKEEVRGAVIRRLRLTEGAVVYDIGSGTGSVAVEIGMQSPALQVYAVEREPRGVDLIEQNCRKHQLTNVEIIAGSAPEALEGLEAPTHVFIGGSGGSLREILAAVYDKNSAARVVITAITLETVAVLADIEQEYTLEDFDLIQLQTHRAKKAGGYHLMQAENAVYIASFTFHGRRR